MERLRVAIDLRPLQHESGYRGIGTYIRRLVHALADHGRHQYVGLYHVRGPRPDGLPLPLHPMRGPKHAITVTDSLFLWRALRPVADVYHSTEYALPRSRRPMVMTVHDLIPLEPIYWCQLSRRLRWVYRIKYRSMNWAQQIVCVSPIITRQVMHRCPQLRTRIATVPTAILPHIPTCAYEGREIQTGPPQWLVVGAIEPRKGLEELIPVFQGYKKALKEYEWVFHFVGITRDKAYFDQFRQQIPSDLEDQVLFHGWVPDEDLYRFYHEATALLFLSRAEGFGLPVLEALSHGCPVIARSLTVLKEAFPRGVYYLPRVHPGSLFRAMKRLSQDPELRKRLVEEARPLLERYHAREMAERMDEIYWKAYESARLG